MLARSAALSRSMVGLAVGAPLGLLAAVVGSAVVAGVALVRGRRERRAELEAGRALAEVLAAGLGLMAPRPCERPWREGAWELEGVVEGCVLRLIVGRGGAEVSFAVAGAAGLDLARDEDFGRGGIANPREAPYVPLPVEVLGPGWWVRGAEGPRRARGLPRALLEALREPGRRLALVDGRVSTFFAPSDASAAAVRELVRRLPGH